MQDRKSLRHSWPGPPPRRSYSRVRRLQAGYSPTGQVTWAPHPMQDGAAAHPGKHLSGRALQPLGELTGRRPACTPGAGNAALQSNGLAASTARCRRRTQAPTENKKTRSSSETRSTAPPPLSLGGGDEADGDGTAEDEAGIPVGVRSVTPVACPAPRHARVMPARRSDPSR